MRKSSLGGIQCSLCHLIILSLDIDRDIRGIYFAAGDGGEGQSFEFVVFFWDRRWYLSSTLLCYISLLSVGNPI